MILSAIILLNGLIGVFSQAFTAKDEDEAAKEDEREKTNEGNVGDYEKVTT